MSSLDAAAKIQWAALACALLLCGGCRTSTLMRLAVPPSQVERVNQAARFDGGTVILHAAGLGHVKVEEVQRLRVVTVDGRVEPVPLPVKATRAADRLVLLKPKGGSLQFELRKVDYLLVDAQIPKPWNALDYLTVAIVVGGPVLLGVLLPAFMLMNLGDDEIHQRWDGK